MHKQVIQGLVFFLILIYCNLAYGQSVTVGPDGKFEKNVISVPYAFYNKILALPAPTPMRLPDGLRSKRH